MTKPSNNTAPSAPGLVFVFHYRERPWNVLKGLAAPSHSVWQATAYPSKEYAIGESWEDAKENLRHLIEREVASCGKPASQWYAEQFKALDSHDHSQFTQTLLRAYWKLRGDEAGLRTGGHLELPEPLPVEVLDEFDADASPQDSKGALCHGMS